MEALFRNNDQFFKGKISAVLNDGEKYNIDYDDGDKEAGIPRENLRPLARMVGGYTTYFHVSLST